MRILPYRKVHLRSGMEPQEFKLRLISFKDSNYQGDIGDNHFKLEPKIILLNTPFIRATGRFAISGDGGTEIKLVLTLPIEVALTLVLITFVAFGIGLVDYFLGNLYLILALFPIISYSIAILFYNIQAQRFLRLFKEHLLVSN